MKARGRVGIPEAHPVGRHINIERETNINSVNNRSQSFLGGIKDLHFNIQTVGYLLKYKINS